MAERPQVELPAQYGSAADVCRMLGITRWTLRRRVKAGLLPKSIPSPAGTRAPRWDLRAIAELMRKAAEPDCSGCVDPKCQNGCRMGPLP